MVYGVSHAVSHLVGLEFGYVVGYGATMRSFSDVSDVVSKVDHLSKF